MGWLSFVTEAVASIVTPTTGKAKVYVDSTSKRLSSKDDAGLVVTYVGAATTDAITGAKTFTDSTILMNNPAATFAYTIKSSAITAARQLTLPLITQTETLAVVPQKYISAVLNPTGTTNTTGLMMGMAGAITPRVTGSIMITICGDITNSTAASGSNVQIRYGTGTAPANAAALTGTTLGGLVKFIASPTTTSKSPFSLTAYLTGATVGTALWIDVGLAAVTSGTATIADVTIVAWEI